MPTVLYWIALLVLMQLKGTETRAFVDPPSDSLIADIEGMINATTLTCNVTDGQVPPTQLETRWSIQDFRGETGLQTITNTFDTNLFFVSGDPMSGGGSFLNRLTILRLTSELDGVTVFCGIGAFPQQANFLLRVYYPPNLQDNLILKIVQNSVNVPIDLSQDPPPYPVPASFNWTKDGAPLMNGLAVTYSNITFPVVSRNDSGRYQVSTTNYVLGSDTKQVGTDTGSFILDVIYQLTITNRGPPIRYVLLGDNLSLVCGTGLDSNPQATVTWTAPDGTTIMSNARYDLENGPDIVRLNVTNTVLEDDGFWKCNITVISEQYTVNNGRLMLMSPTTIGQPDVYSIQLIVVSPPGRPNSLMINNIEATSVTVHWSSPSMAEFPISYYLINVYIQNSNNFADTRVINTTVITMFYNVTGLLPGTTYESTVVAVSQVRGIIAKSQASNTVVGQTKVTVPALICNAPVSSNGVVTVTWSYIHTGGLPLTSVSVSYRSNEDLRASVSVPVTVTATNVTSVMVPGLVAGFEYTFNLTAQNKNGSSSILCGPTLHRVGRPASPMFGELMSGPDAGEVTVMIKTVAPGVEDPSQVFWFVITPIRDDVMGQSTSYFSRNYKRGQFIKVVMDGLDPGETYVFNATATNVFGHSESVTSDNILAGIDSLSAKSNTISTIVGGVLGGLIFFILLAVLITLLALIKKLPAKQKGDADPIGNNGKSEAVYEDLEPHLHKTAQKDIKLNECPAYITVA